MFSKNIDITFSHKIENGEKEKEEVMLSMLGSNLLLITILYCKLLVAMTVDVPDILQTSKHNFQSQAKHKNMSNLVLLGGNIFQ